jgi:DNA-binding FrmR family transcriptional regulator
LEKIAESRLTALRQIKGCGAPSAAVHRSRLTWYRGVPYIPVMSHIIKEKKKLLARVGRIRGQVEALERALATEMECARVMHMIAGIRGSVSGLMAEVIEDHVRTHLVDPERNPDALNAEAAEQLIDVVHTYLK